MNTTDTPEPQILGEPPGNPPPDPAPTDEIEREAKPDNGADLEALRGEMKRDRFDAVAARAGVDEGYVDVALALFESSGKEPTKRNMAAFIDQLKKSKPALFGPQPANTAPTPSTSAPAAPAPGVNTSPHQQWRALMAAGRKAEAEAFYMRHRHQINRSA